MAKDRSTRDIVISNETKLVELKLQFSNHLKHHWAVSIICAAAALTGLMNFGIAMFIIFIK